MQLHEAAQALNAAAVGADVALSAVVTDTRKLTPGCLFVALKGPRYDGHSLCRQGAGTGAAAVMVERRRATGDQPAIVVDDTLQALGRLGRLASCQRMPARLPPSPAATARPR
jgi:UDP-N-acetylmuramoyl-tripeptide--D-alanyl-D-alanine ligase